MRLVFDIETDGLLDKLTLLHCLVLRDIDTGVVMSCADHKGYAPIEEGLKLLAKADMIIGHNIMKFDIPAIQKVYRDWRPQGVVRDTLVMSRLIWPDRKPFDAAFRDKYGEDALPGKLFGRHSLEAWGYRLKAWGCTGDVLKGDFGKTTDWARWTKEMQDYCEQDVTVTLALWKKLEEKNTSETAIELEHEFQKVILKQEQHGFCFDVDKARALYGTLSKRRAELETNLQEAFPPITIRTPFTPKVNNKKLGYQKGVTIYRERVEEFNPNSDIQVAKRLQGKYGWKPERFTPTGQPQVSEEVLKELQYPEIPLLVEYMMIQKRIGQLAEGNGAWLKVEKNGVIHGEVVTNGAVTGRCTHKKPNIAQVPKASKSVPYGYECRELFYAPYGYSLVGCDASGLELRCLAHYLSRYDNGAYAKIILEGDIHTANQHAAGLETRDQAKRFIYAFLYGAGNTLLGSIVAPHASKRKQAGIGNRLKESFFAKIPAIKRLSVAIENRIKEKQSLIGLDGRVLHIRSAHSALNLLLQAAGALIMKQATVILWKDLEAKGYKFGKEVAQVAHIHDEYQLYVMKGLEDEVGKVAVDAIRKAGDFFGFRCPLDGEYKVGQNWAETH